MTQAEFEEMRTMALERSRVALCEALHALREVWSQRVANMPRAEAKRLRARLRRAHGLPQALAASKAAPSAQKEGLELALMWERCRVRALVALAVQLDRADLLRRALALAMPLGLSVEVESDLCAELEDREMTSRPVSREPSEPASPTDQYSEGGWGSDGQQDDSRSQTPRSPPPPRGRRWWPLSWGHRGPWKKGDEGLLGVVQDHVKRGGKPVPHELAADLGLRASAKMVANTRQPGKGATVRQSLAEESPLSRAGNVV